MENTGWETVNGVEIKVPNGGEEEFGGKDVDWILTDGHLVVSDFGGRPLACYAPGQWLRVTRTSWKRCVAAA